jgi:hypothetical protein
MRFAATVRVLRFLAATLFPIIVLFILGAVALLVTKSPFSKMQWALNFQFAANKSFIVFPALLPRDEIGLVWIDRSTHSRKLIRVDGADLRSPSISDDGQRLLFVKHHSSSDSREVVRCAINTWHCHVLFNFDGQIYSPIEIGAGNVLLAAGELIERPNGRKGYYRNYFFYFESATGTLEKLTDLVSPVLGDLQYVKPRVYFTAFLPGEGKSGIYSREFNEKTKRFNDAPLWEPMNPSNVLTSTNFACSDQCRLMAYQYLSSEYDLVILASGDVPETVKTNAQGISRPSVVGDDVIINELFESEYVVTAYRLGGKNEVLERLSNSPGSLEALEHIRLSFSKADGAVYR